MNRKLVVLLVVVLSVIFTFLIAQYGSNPYSDNPIQATYIKLSSDELVINSDNGEDKIYYYLEKLEENETKSFNIYDFVELDPNATNGLNTLRYSIIYDSEDGVNSLTLTDKGTFAGRVTYSGQVSATVTVSTTDGSGLQCFLYIRPNNGRSNEEHGGEIFK